MSATLHLLSGQRTDLAAEVIARDAAAGEAVTVVLLTAAAAPPVTEGVTVRRVPDDLSWAQVLDLIYAADRVVAW